MAGCLAFLVSKCDNNIKQLQVMSPSCFSTAFEILFWICQNNCKPINKNREKHVPLSSKDKRVKSFLPGQRPRPISLRLAEVQLHLGEACRMNPSNIKQQLKAELGEKGTDAVGVWAAPRLECNFSTKVRLSDLHKTAAQLNSANIYLPFAGDKVIMCCGECNHIRPRVRAYASPVIFMLSG